MILAYKLKIALSILLTILIIGTIGFHFIEDWSVIDSFYTTITTLTTVGYGDFTPENNSGKNIYSFYNCFWRRHDAVFVRSGFGSYH